MAKRKYEKPAIYEEYFPSLRRVPPFKLVESVQFEDANGWCIVRASIEVRPKK